MGEHELTALSALGWIAFVVMVAAAWASSWRREESQLSRRVT